MDGNSRFAEGNGGKRGSHNTETGDGNEGYIIRRIMLTNVTNFTIYCVKIGRNPRYLVLRLT